MDWNWLFSAIAQSTAAIAGIFGAFIVTKVLNSQSQYNSNNSKLIETISQSETLGNSSELYHVHWLANEIENSAYNSLRLKLDETKSSSQLKSAEEYYTDLEFSGFRKKSDLIIKIKEIIKDKIDTYKKEGIEARISKKNTINIEFWPDETKYGPARAEHSKFIREYILNIEHQIKTNQAFYHKLAAQPESSPLVTFSIISIMLLFYTGVIYPLSFMPMPIDANINLTLSAFWDILFSLKGALLSAISIIFTLLLLVFLIINFKLQYNQKLLQDLLSYTKIENFNEPLNNMKINKNLPDEIALSFNWANK